MRRMGQVGTMAAVASMTSMAAVRAMPCKKVRITRILFQNQRVDRIISFVLGNTKISIATELSCDTLSG